MPTLAQWQHPWLVLGVDITKTPTTLYQQVLARYDEPHRHYHTLQHLDECLAHFDELRHLADHPAEVELTLWFHDAIYEPTQPDNEQLSAQWATSSMIAAGLNECLAERVHALIIATCHQEMPKTTDAEIVVDCDLAILGANIDRFAEYEHQIRAEYAFVPEAIFNEKRREILQGFLDRPAIFNTAEFIDRYEQQARSNLIQAVRQF